MANFGKIYESSWFGEGVCANTVGWGSSYKSIANCSDASFSYAEASYAKDGTDPTPTITGDAGGTFTATPAGLSINSSTGEITLSTSTINSYTVKYTLADGTFTDQTLGITAASFSNVFSCEFDGVDDYIDTGTISLGGASAFTISCWVKTSNTSFQNLMGDNNLRYIISTASNRLDLTFNGSVDFRSTDFILNSGQWHNVITTFDGSLTQANRLKVYVDGVQVTNNLSGTTSTTLTASGDFMIGRRGSFSQKEWNGFIDEVAIWNSVQNVSTIYNSGSPTTITGGLNWWRMGDPNGTSSFPTITDNGSSGDNGTMKNMSSGDIVEDAPS